MVIACTAKMGKFLIVIVNFVLGALGAALLAIGIWSKVDSNIYKVLTFLPNIGWVSTLAIVVGAIIFLIGFCGCFGACCEIRLLLFIYEALMFVLVVAELCVLVALIFLGAGAESLLMDGAKQVIKNSIGNTQGLDGELSTLIYGIQFNVKCCGVESYEDYFPSHYQTTNNNQCSAVPLTCCESNGGNETHPVVINQTACCDKNVFNSTVGRYTKGCLRGIFDKVFSLVPTPALIAVPIIAVAAIALQIVVMLATMGLLCAVNEAQSHNDQQRYTQRPGVYTIGQTSV